MTKDELFVLLSKKNPEMDDEVCRHIYDYIGGIEPLVDPIGGRNFVWPHKMALASKAAMALPRWYIREQTRQALNVYPERTEILNKINSSYPWLCVHISKVDAKKVAYTPSSHDGERDAQIVVTMEKLLTRLYPHLPAHAVAEIAAEHHAESDDTLEILYGQDIVDVYTSGVQGACMSKGGEAYTGKMNPTLCYIADNIGMAVVRDLNGNITGRCMIYTPSPDDKRYIRVYNSKLLKRRLERNGFRAGTWNGAKFNTIGLNLEGNPNHYLVPYLDGNGEMANGAVTSAVALIDGVLTCIDKEYYNRIYKMLGQDYVGIASSQYGAIRLRNIDTGSLTVTCALTGVQFNRLEEDHKRFYSEVEIDGQRVGALGVALASAIRENRANLYTLKLRDSGGTVEVLSQDSTKTFYHGGWHWLDNKECREYTGWQQLDIVLYPDNREWYKKDIVKVEEIGTYILQEDSIAVIKQLEGQMPLLNYQHKSTYDKTKHVLVHNPSRHTYKKVYAEKSSDMQIVKIHNGAKAVVDWHDIAKDVDGNWGLIRSMKSFEIANKVYYTRPDADLAPIKERMWNALIVSTGYRADVMIDYTYHIGEYPYGEDGRRLYAYDYQRKLNISVMRKWINGGTNKTLKQHLYNFDVWQAECNAIDYTALEEFGEAMVTAEFPEPVVEEIPAADEQSAEMVWIPATVSRLANTSALNTFTGRYAPNTTTATVSVTDI